MRRFTLFRLSRSWPTYRRSRTAVLWATLPAAAILLASYCYSLVALPPPDRCDLSQLTRYLATRDLQRESESFRWAILDRLEELVVEPTEPRPPRGGSVRVAPESGRSADTSHYQKQLEANAVVLAQMWLRDRAARLVSQQDPAARREQLQRQALLLKHLLRRWEVPVQRGGPTPLGSIAARVLADLSPTESAQAYQLVAATATVWLATDDLSRLPESKRKSLLALLRPLLTNAERTPANQADVRRLSQATGAAVRNTLEGLPAAQRTQLNANLRILLSDWLRQEAVAYAQLSDLARTHYLQSLAAMARQGAALLQGGEASSGVFAQWNTAMRLYRIVQASIQASPTDEQPAIEELVRALWSQWLRQPARLR